MQAPEHAHSVANHMNMDKNTQECVSTCSVQQTRNRQTYLVAAEGRAQGDGFESCQNTLRIRVHIHGALAM